MLFGPESRNYPTPWSQQSTQLAGLSIANLQLVILGVSMLVTLVLFFFSASPDSVWPCRPLRKTNWRLT